MGTYPVLDVTSWEVDAVEPGGDDEKLWLIDPETETPRSRWLYKPATVKQLSNGSDYRRLEDMAERVCFELAQLVGLPAAPVELAVRDTRRGSMSLNLRSYEWELQTGSVLIGGVDDRYRPRNDHDPGYQPIGHNLDNIFSVLKDAMAAPGVADPLQSAVEVFAGYLVFDAWVANTDRHERNWAVLVSPEGQLHLAPSFDHGSALASGLTDENRLTKDVRKFARRAFSHRFEGGKRIPLLDLAVDASMKVGSRYWLDKIAEVTTDQCRAVVNAVPNLSDAARTFTTELLVSNLERIGDV